MATSEELLKQMYDSNLASQKATLQSDYDAAISDLDAQKAAAQKNTENNIRLTKTEADRSAVNAAEYYEAAGLSSGAKAQARVAQDNQLLADLTAIRSAQQQGDTDIERQRGLLSQQFATAIREAQANNDMAKAQALYEAAKEAEANLLARQKEAANAMAGAGDFSLYAQLYGLTPEQIKTLEASYNSQNAPVEPEQSPIPGMTQEAYDRYLDYAKAYANETGDYSLWYKLISYNSESPNGTGAVSGAVNGVIGATGKISGAGNGAAGAAGTGNDPELTTAKQTEIADYVQGLLDSGTSAAWRTKDIINNSSRWNATEKAFALEILQEYLSSGYMLR